MTRHATPVSTSGTTLKSNSSLGVTPKTPKVSKLTATPVVRSPAARRRDPHITQTPDLPRESGRVFVFGNGESGQLGLGDKIECKKPTPVRTLKNEEVVDVVAGGLHTIAITKEGKVVIVLACLSLAICVHRTTRYHAHSLVFCNFIILNSFLFTYHD